MHRRIALSSLMLVALLGMTFSTPHPVAAQGAPFCPPGQSAQFMFGISELHDHLGATMGVPLECEHINADNGDTLQHTSTGLAYYRPSINTPMFTDGQTHWSLSNNHVLMWRNPSVTPPQPTAAESSYLQTAYALAQQLDAYQVRIGAIRQQADAGRLDAVDVGDVGALYDDISNTRTTIAHAPPSDRLAVYDQALTQAFDEAVASAELLLRARLTDIPEARSAFVNEAAAHTAESNRLQGVANSAYSLALPVVVG